ncbi:MAG: acyltransferase [Deltaproteobacteria bacterium]|nr:acyltransferase [Deltaproteobacteria bacterium]
MTKNHKISESPAAAPTPRYMESRLTAQVAHTQVIAPVPEFPGARITEGRVKALDGVRGLAIAMVMIGHIGEFGTDISPIFRAVYALSWIGVELFFALSGFLITSILLETLNTKTYLARFYLRRFWRIVPLYYVVLTVTTFVLPQIFTELITPEMAATWRDHAPWYYGFLANFMMLRLNDMPKDPVTVAWSLAIEEQFYLVWPLVVMSFRRWRPLGVLGSLIALSIGLKAVLLMRGWNEFHFYLFTPTRLEPLVIGSALALARHHGYLRSFGTAGDHVWPLAKWPFARLGCIAAVVLLFLHLLSLLSYGVAGVGVVATVIESLTYYLLIGIMFTSLLGYVLAKPDSDVARLFQKKWLCQLGLWSYSIYLTHNLINHGLAQSGLTFGILGTNVVGLIGHGLVTVTLSVGVGCVLYVYVERPIISWRNRCI